MYQLNYYTFPYIINQFKTPGEIYLLTSINLFILLLNYLVFVNAQTP